MIDLWWHEAARNDVLPLDNRPLWALIHKKPDQRRERPVFRYFQGGSPVPESVAVPVQNRSHVVRADVVGDDDDDDDDDDEEEDAAAGEASP